MKSPITKVSKHTGMNSIARAVAKVKFASDVTDMRINIFLMDEGAEAIRDYRTMGVLVTSLMLCLEPESVEYRKLKSANRLINQRLLEGGEWHKDDTVTLDNALAIAASHWPQIPAKQANDALNKVLETQ